MNPEAVLRTFAEISTSRPASARTDVIDRASHFALQRYTVAGLLTPSAFAQEPAANLDPMPGAAVRNTGRILAASALHRTEQLLRLGWIWFAGTVEQPGEPVQYCFPALSAPVALPPKQQRSLTPPQADASRLSRAFDAISNATSAAGTPSWVRRVGDVEVTDLIENPDVRLQLLHQAEFGGGALVEGYAGGDRYVPVDPRLLPRLSRLRAWYRSVASEVGLRITDELLVQQANPIGRRTQPGVAVIVAYGLYLDNPPTVGTRRESLLATAAMGRLNHTALGRIYGDRRDHREPRRRQGPSIQPLSLRPVSDRQRRIVQQVASEPAAVVSGAPGTGKSHILTVIALDAVARGQSVLVAADSPYAVDVLVEHFAQAPGPTPVAFGGSAHGTQLAKELAELASRHSGGQLRMSEAVTHEELRRSVERLLDTEVVAGRLKADPARWLDLTERLDRAGDLFELDDWISSMGRRGPLGWWARRRRRQGVARRLGLPSPGIDPSDVRQHLDSLRQGSAARRLLAEDGLSLTRTLDEMTRIEERAARQQGDRIVHEWLDGLSRKHRQTLGSLASAISLDRASRRARLAALNPRLLTEAAPLWVGSVRDVDEVLPPVSGLFDLAILDEASQMDQLGATSALARAKRVVVCGDPHQLGHVSFLSDEVIEEAAIDHGVDPTAINPRRLSMFDMASSRAPLHVLDEHFRSAPHLIEFSARRLYKSGLHLVTRCPATEAADHIHVELVDGSRSQAKVNRSEVTATLEIGQRYMDQGWRSIGFITPFRPQADALEAALLDRYRLEEIEHYGLRVGTVHSFQGDERDVIIASWAVGPDEGEGAWRFLNQRNLFNVMVTRAREIMHVVTSVAEPPGLAGDYLRWSEPLTDLITDEGSTDPWVMSVAEVARDSGLTVRPGYRVGRHLVDLVIGEDDKAVAVDCVPHPGGPAAHIDRAMMLRRAGWRTFDAFPSRWSDRRGDLGVELKALMQSP